MLKSRNTDLFFLWQGLVAASYRSFFDHLARNTTHRIALASPAKFKELGQQKVDCAPCREPFSPQHKTYPFYVLRTMNLHVQAVIFLGLSKALRAFFGKSTTNDRIVVCVAEPYSVTAVVAWITARIKLGRDFLFVCYAAQNIFKSMPIALKLIQSFVFERSAAILVVGKSQEELIRRHGFIGRTIDFPLWFDSSRFKVRDNIRQSSKIIVGYAGVAPIKTNKLAS